MTGIGRIGLVVVALLSLAAAVTACRREPAPRAPGPMRVVVTVAPLTGLVQRLAPEGTQVTTIFAPGRSEHGYELTAGDAQALRAADLVVFVGLGLEPQVERHLARSATPPRKVVSFARAIGLEKPGATPDHDEPGHTHADDHGHSHGSVDPHLWLDPDLVLKFVPHLARAIADAAPPGTPGMDKAAPAQAKLEADIRALDAECKAKLAPLAGTAIVTHHAAWGRFAEHFGLKVAAVIRPIEIAEPTKADMDAAIAAIRDQGARAVFVEPQFNADVARKIADLARVRLGVLNPLGDSDGDWFKLMRSNTDSLVRTLAE